MEWWAEWWNSVAQWFGYEAWNWSTAAEWFGAVGTVGALFLGIGIFMREERRKRRKQIESLSVWIEKSESANGVDHPVDRVILRNDGSATLYGVTLATPARFPFRARWATRGRWRNQRSVAYISWKVLDSIEPGKVVSVESRDPSDLAILFRDASGTIWRKKPSEYGAVIFGRARRRASILRGKHLL